MTYNNKFYKCKGTSFTFENGQGCLGGVDFIRYEISRRNKV